MVLNLNNHKIIIILRNFGHNVLPEKFQILTITFGVYYFVEFVELLNVSFLIQLGDYVVKLLDICLLLQEFIDIGSVSLSMESICHRLFISFLTQRVIYKVEIGLLLKHLVQECKIFRKRALIDALVEIFAHFVNFLAHLTKFDIDFMNITLGQKNS